MILRSNVRDILIDGIEHRRLAKYRCRLITALYPVTTHTAVCIATYKLHNKTFCDFRQIFVLVHNLKKYRTFLETAHL